MDSMKSSNLLSSKRGPILSLLWLFCLATLSSGAATGVNRFSAFSQPVGPFTVIPNDDEIVLRLPPSHSSVRNFGGGEAPRAQQNFGIPLSLSPQGNGFNQPSPARDTQEPNHSPKFFVLNKDSNGNGNGRNNAAVRSHFVAPGPQPRGIPLAAVSQESSNGQRSSTGINSAAANSAQAINPSSSSGFFVLQDDNDRNFNLRANSVRSNGFRENTNGNGANRGIPLQLGNQGSSFRQQSVNSAAPSNGAALSSNPSSTFFVVENSAEVEDSLAIMSLGRRFHPNGIPIIANPVETSVTKEASQITPEVQSPFLLTPNSLFVLKDESLEDLRDDDIDEQKIVVDLSPMVKAHNHNTVNERLSLSSNFLNQYNFVDVKGSTSFGYKTDDQYQDHVVHRSGKHEGKFGWTAPEGSKHHIEYIADEKGYRVITSSGIYLNDEPTVKTAKDNHFDEHRKVLENLANMKRNNVLKSEQAPTGQSGTIGIPLPDMINEQSESSVVAPQPGFVVIESDDEIPLFSQDFDEVIVPVQYPDDALRDVTGTAEHPNAATGSSSKFGVPLPEILTRDESSPMEPSQSTFSHGVSQFGISLQNPDDIIVPIQYPAAATPVAGGAASSPTLGIPIPETPVRAESSQIEPSQSTSVQGVNQFGITLHDPEDVVVPIQYPVESFGGAATGADAPVDGGAASSPSFGIPIPESPVRAENAPVEPSQPTSFQDVNQFGITHQDPQNVVVPIQYPEESFGGAATGAHAPVDGGAASSSSFGIPNPESPVRAESGPVEPSQPTSFQGVNQFGITLQDPENVVVPIQYPEGSFGGAATAAETSVTGGAASSPSFGIPIPETPERAESAPVEPSQPTSSKGESQFGIPIQDPENIIEPIQYPEETFGGAATTAEEPIAGGGAPSFPDFGITPINAETSPVEPSQSTFMQGGSQFGNTLQDSEAAAEEIQRPETGAQPAVPSEIPRAITVESPKLNVKIGLEETASNKIEGFGVALPSPTQTQEQNLNSITGTGGFTVITEDRPFIALNNVRDSVRAEPEGNTIPSGPETSNFNEAANNNLSPGGSTFSNQFFVVSPTNANHGIGLFPDETGNQQDSKPSDLLQGPPFANKENQNLIRRRS